MAQIRAHVAEAGDLRDRDGTFPPLFDAILNDAGIQVVLSGIQMPWMNSIIERWPLNAYDVQVHSYCIRAATSDDLDGARTVMLDTVYHVFGTGYVPRWHADIIDPQPFYLASPRHTLLVAVNDTDHVVATAALDSRGPAHPPNPHWLAERYPSGETAQLRRVYVRPEHRRRGLARQMVRELLEFAKADGGYQAVYLHTYPDSPGATELWQSLGEVVCDERHEVPDGGSGVVHFEIPLN